MLEERLIQYQGTLLVVSHDREFLNNVVTTCIAYESDGVREYVGGFDDWVRQSLNRSSPQKPPQVDSTIQARPKTSEEPSRIAGKLSFKERQELQALPGQIEAIEAEIAQLHQDMIDPAYFKRPPQDLVADQERLAGLQSKLEDAMLRWESLESRS